ncbi:MAG: roadblock/LC7 domain-containing protein [Promethearchaeota archaeon]
MAVDISEQIRISLMKELSKIETESDLSHMTVLARSGMRIATADSSSVDADPITASSAALIDVGIRFIGNMNHGTLREILIRGKGGYAILMYIDNEYMTFAGLSNPARIGYYLEFLRMKCKLFSYLLAGGRVTDELKAELEAEKKRQEKGEESLKEMFSSDASSSKDMSAMQDVLSFLDDWGGEEETEGSEADHNSTGIVGIEEDFMIGGGDVKEDAESPKFTQVQKLGDEFPVYDNEVPPIPLEDIEALEIHSDDTPNQSETDLGLQKDEEPEQSKTTEQILGSSNDQEPDFNELSASEYNDSDLDLSEDIMLEALADLGYTNNKKDKKKKEI